MVIGVIRRHYTSTTCKVRIEIVFLEGYAFNWDRCAYVFELDDDDDSEEKESPYSHTQRRREAHTQAGNILRIIGLTRHDVSPLEFYAKYLIIQNNGVVIL